MELIREILVFLARSAIDILPITLFLFIFHPIGPVTSSFARTC
jgi:hypothetical protein